MSKRNYPFISAFFFITSVILFVLRDLYNPYYIYFLLNITLLFYVTFIVNKLRKKYSYKFVFNPLAISLIINFLFFSGGLTYFFLYENYIPLTIVNSEIYVNPIYYAEAGFLINISSIFMVIGFNSKIAFKFNQLLLKIFKNFSYKTPKIGFGGLIILILIIYGLKLFLFQNSLFGRSGNIDSELASSLSLLSKISLLPISLCSYSYFKYGRNQFLFYTCLVLELIFSFFEAARSPILSLFLILSLVYIYVNGIIPIKLFLYGFIVFIIAFTLFSDFKKYVEDGNVRSTSMIKTFSDYVENNTLSDFDFKYFKITAFGRLNYVSEISAAVQYKQQNGISENDPNFLKSLGLVPIKVFLPNSITGIQNYSFGDWFRFQVQNRGTTTQQYNIAFSPIAFLFFSGGYIFVFLGFFFYGILLKSIHNLPQLGFTGFIFFILIGSSIFQFKTNIPASLVTFFRFIILIPVTFKILKLFKLTK